MIKNYKTGVVIVPKEIVEIIEKAEKTTTEIKSVYDYFLKYKETNKIFELRKDVEVKRITKVVFDEVNETIETDLFVISEDSFEEKNVEEDIQGLESDIQELENSMANKQDKLIAGNGIDITENIISAIDELSEWYVHNISFGISPTITRFKVCTKNKNALSQVELNSLLLDKAPTTRTYYVGTRIQPRNLDSTPYKGFMATSTYWMLERVSTRVNITFSETTAIVNYTDMASSTFDSTTLVSYSSTQTGDYGYTDVVEPISQHLAKILNGDRTYLVL